jgi:NADPH-dependent glutamate synthase beta subunit-like oxidoreductase
MNIHPGHCVAIFGGAVAGAEAADLLSRQGIYTVVFEQNALPYGKIEDGLPKWHVKLRDKEEQKINEKLAHPYVFYVPRTKLGRDIDFETVVNAWGFSAVLLAIGAWRDRPLPVDGIDAYIGKGLYYQNPFIYWFNHYHEPEYSGEIFEVPDETIVVGGGLASIDVIKALMIVTVGRALQEHGHKVDFFALEKDGPAKVLQELNLTPGSLGLKGCTLFYRRRAINMPLTPIRADADERRLKKAYEVRQRMIDKLQNEFLFKFYECHSPVEKIVEGDRLAGLVFQKTEVVDGKAKPIAGAFVEVRAPLVISSIGSIPELIPGVPAKGTVFKITDEATGQIEDYPNVFALGNTVTGRGNIMDSRKHGIQVGKHVLEDFLGWKEEYHQALAAEKTEQVAAKVSEINAHLKEKSLLTAEQITSILSKVKERQQQVGFDGDFEKWRGQHLPKRLEDMGNEHAV